MKLLCAVLGSVLLATLGASVQAQILIGQTSGFSGSSAVGAKETTAGAQLYLEAVNAKGGIHGQKIELRSLDDQSDPQLAVKNARNLIEEQHVLALFLTRGTPQTEAILPLLEQHGVPLIAPPRAPWCCTSRSKNRCSTCARPTSAKRKKRWSIWPALAFAGLPSSTPMTALAGMA